MPFKPEEAKKEIVKKISDTISKFYKLGTGKWISILDFSFATELTNVGINKNYSKAVLDVLKKHGLVESEGVRTGVKYKLTGTIQDTKKLAEEIFLYNRELVRVTNLRYRKGDTTPMRAKEYVEPQIPNTRVLAKTLPTVRDKVYIIHDNHIVEGYIYSVSEAGDTGLNFSVRITPARKKEEKPAETAASPQPAPISTEAIAPNAETDPTEAVKDVLVSAEVVAPPVPPKPYILIHDINLAGIFQSPEDAASYMVRKVVPYTHTIAEKAKQAKQAKAETVDNEKREYRSYVSDEDRKTVKVFSKTSGKPYYVSK